MRLQLRIFFKAALLFAVVGFANSSFAATEQAFNIEEPEFDLKIVRPSGGEGVFAAGQAQGIRALGEIRKGNALMNLLGLNTLNYDSRYPESWAWVDPSNPLIMTLKFPGGSHQQINLGLSEVVKLQLHFENSSYSMAAGAWLTVFGIRELAGELKPVEIQIKITDGWGGYLDTDFVSPLLTEEEKKIANQPGGQISVMVNDPYPRNLPPAGRDLAPKIQQVTLRQDLRPEVTIITPFPNLEWANERDGHLVKMGSAISMKMAGPAGRASAVFGSMDDVRVMSQKQNHDSLEGFDDSSIYVYLPTGHALAAAIGEVVAQRLDGMTTPKLALKITGRVERTNIVNFGGASGLAVRGQTNPLIKTDPFLTVSFEQSYSIPFFRFQGDVKVEAVTYDAGLLKNGGCEDEAKKP